MIRRAFYLATILIIAAHAGLAHAQSRGNDITIEKKDGKFAGSVTAESSTTYPGLISDIEVRFVWSGIFDQPTEYYQFIWNRSGSISYAGATFLRDRLKKYPDLLRRFDDLRPGNIELSVDVVFGEGINLDCAQGYQSNVGCITSFSKTLTQTPHLMVAASGQVGDNITPTSPADNWLGFFATRHLSGTPEDINRKLHDMMRRADTLRVRNLRLVSYSVPPTTVSEIIEDFYAREAKEAEKKLTETDPNKDKDEEKGLFDKITGLFKSDDEKDDFWNGDSDTSEASKDSDGFWNGLDDKAEKNAKKSDNFWNDTQAGQANNNDVQKVKIDLGIGASEKAGCGRVTYKVYQEGYQDARGNWLTPPRKTVATERIPPWVDAPLTYRSGNSPRPTEAQRKAAKKRCWAQLNEKAREIETRYR